MRPNPAQNLQAGFTLIELVVVVSLTVMLLLTASAVFLTFLIGGAKVNSTQAVKQEGTYALNQIEFLIRNSIELIPNSSNVECGTAMTELALISIDGGTTTLTAETVGSTERIASNSGIFLTSDNVDVISGPTFDCSQTDDEGRPHVIVNFTLRKGTPGVDQARDIVEETFTTGATLRSL